MGEFAVEQARDARADGMRFEKNDSGMAFAKPHDLRFEGGMIRREVKIAAPCDFIDIGRCVFAVERLAVETRGRAQFRRILPGI